MFKFQEQLDSQQAVPLVHTELSKVELYSAPLQDQSQLKRVVLFSDHPYDDNEQVEDEPKDQISSSRLAQERAGASERKYISIKICESEWHDLLFDETTLQGDSILLKDSLQHQRARSEYEIVANVQFLPSPFNFSKIIEFKPRYMFVNKTFSCIQIIQAGCEEKGAFKAYPSETSVFHWTDSSMQHEINIKLEEYDYSGNIRIDGIGEINLRLRGQYENQSVILNVSITEERGTLFVIFNDVSYAPPYRIENLTKTSFKIQQFKARTNDFDILRPYQIMSYAWSYPLNEKKLKISICEQSNEVNLGMFRIDKLNKNEKIVLSDNQSERQFLFEVINEKSMKIIRLSYTDEFTQNDITNKISDDSQVKQGLHKYIINLR